MVQQITKGIKVSVQSKFEGAFYKNAALHFAFAYNVTIENQGKDAVQLTHRHWDILDALNREETVDGEGVIGQKPVLMPGDKHTYSSGCILAGPIGAMKGHYHMVNFATTAKFKVAIPTFILSAPFAIN